MSALKFINWFEEQYGKGVPYYKYLEQKEVVYNLELRLMAEQAKLKAMAEYENARTNAMYGWNAARKYLEEEHSEGEI